MADVGKLNDATIAAMAGSSEVLLAANPARRYLMIANPGTANLTVNLVGGAAVAGGAGCITLSPITATGPLNQIVFEDFVPNTALTVRGTAGQPCACFWA